MEITIRVNSIEELRQMAAQVLAEKVEAPEPVGTVDTPAEYNPEPKAQEPKAQEPKEAPKPVDIAVVRAKLTEVHKACAPDTVKGLLASYGAEKLTAVDPANYADIMAKAAVLLEKSNG